MTITYAIATCLVLVTVAILVRIIRCYLSNPLAALKLTTHDPAQFSEVMAGRYIFFALMLVGALLSGSLGWLAYVFAGLAFVGIYDAIIYHRAGKETPKHALAGAGSLIAAIICGLLATFAPL